MNSMGNKSKFFCEMLAALKSVVKLPFSSLCSRFKFQCCKLVWVPYSPPEKVHRLNSNVIVNVY